MIGHAKRIRNPVSDSFVETSPIKEGADISVEALGCVTHGVAKLS